MVLRAQSHYACGFWPQNIYLTPRVGILVPLGPLSVSRGSILVSVWWPSPSLGTQSEPLGGKCRTRDHLSVEVSSLWGPFSDSSRQRFQESAKSGRPERSRRRSRHQTSPQGAQGGIRVVTAICLECPKHVRLDDLWRDFGYLLGSLVDTVGHQ